MKKCNDNNCRHIVCAKKRVEKKRAARKAAAPNGASSHSMFHGCDVASTLDPIRTALIDYYEALILDEEGSMGKAELSAAVKARVERQMAFLHPGARKAAVA